MTKSWEEGAFYTLLAFAVLRICRIIHKRKIEHKLNQMHMPKNVYLSSSKSKIKKVQKGTPSNHVRQDISNIDNSCFKTVVSNKSSVDTSPRIRSSSSGSSDRPSDCMDSDADLQWTPVSKKGRTTDKSLLDKIKKLETENRELRKNHNWHQVQWAKEHEMRLIFERKFYKVEKDCRSYKAKFEECQVHCFLAKEQANAFKYMASLSEIQYREEQQMKISLEMELEKSEAINRQFRHESRQTELNRSLGNTEATNKMIENFKVEIAYKNEKIKQLEQSLNENCSKCGIRPLQNLSDCRSVSVISPILI